MELHKPLPQSFTNMYILVRDMLKQTNIVLKFQTEEFYVALANIEDWCMVLIYKCMSIIVQEIPL
jgi:hypothetical protein